MPLLSSFERMVAGRYLRARRSESFIAVVASLALVGIALGVAVLIIVMSVMNGFRAELVGRILGLNGHINVYQAGELLSDYESYTDLIKSVEGVTRATPILEQQALISVAGKAGGTVVRGVRPDDFRANSMLTKALSAAELQNFSTGNIAIGIKMAERLKLHIGNQITLLTPQGKATPFGTIPRTQSFTVTAIFDVGMYEYDNAFIYMPLSDAQRFFMNEGGVTAIEVMTANPEDLTQVKNDIYAILAGQVRLNDWTENNATFFNALKVERNVMFIILVLIIAIAAFNIVSSLFILVKDKSRDIAILRTMGAGRASILRIFVATGASIGILGTLLGFLLGVVVTINLGSIQHFLENVTGAELFSSEIYFLSQIPARIEWREVFGIVTTALIIAFLSTVYPALKAARLDPVAVLRMG